MAIPITKMDNHWTRYIPFCSYSTKQFYDTLTATISKHQLPDIEISSVTQKTKGFFSDYQEYLRIQRGNTVVDFCGSPYGSDFFISMWMYQTESAGMQLVRHTKLGSFLRKQQENRTMYQVDTEAMFRGCMNQCVEEAIETITKQTATRS